MRKGIMMALVALMVSMQLFAETEGVKTLGDGTTWTISKLAVTEGSGVSKNGTTFTMANTVVVAEGDYFQMEGGITVQLAAGVSLEIEGDAMMDPQERSTFTRVDDNIPGIVYLKGGNSIISVENIDFEYVGLKYYATKGLNVNDCSFSFVGNNTALNIGGTGAVFTITNSIFENNGRAAIAGAANYSNPITIDNCEFYYNGSENGKTPQLNLTSSSSIIVRNSKVIGDRANTKVGGIMVADLLRMFSNSNTLIENCEVRDNNYGIALYTDQTAIVRNNTLIDNNTETNPMNGGSGINVWDPTLKQNTMITGNYIEGSLWGITIIGGNKVNCGRIDVDETDADYNPGGNTFYNNGCYNTIYDLYNNSANTVYAQNNYWKTATTQDAEGIENCISHKVDNPTLGEVIFTPFATEDLTTIDEAKAATQQAEAIYSLSGIKLSALQKGINIVNMGNKTIKVIGK